MKLKKVELELCSSAEDCNQISCPHIKPHKAITKGNDKCKSALCPEVDMHVECVTYTFEREIKAYNNRANAHGHRGVITTKRR